MKEYIKSKLKENKEAVIIIAVFLFVKLLFMLKYHFLIWDEAVYVGMGKYLFSNGQFGVWEIIRPLGLPSLLGFLWKISFLFFQLAEIMMVLFAGGAIFFTYLIAKRLFNKYVAIIAALFLMATPLFFLYTNYFLTEISSTFFVLGGIYFYLRKWYFWSGLMAAVGFMFKFPQGLSFVALVVSLIILYFIERKEIKEEKKIKEEKENVIHLIKNGAKICMGFAIPAVIFFIFNYIIYHSETSKIWHALFRPFILASSHQGNLANAVLNPLYNYGYYFVELFKDNYLLVFAVIGVWFFLRNQCYKKTGNVVLVFLVLYFVYFTLIVNKQLRFALLFLPYVAIFGGYGLVEFTLWFQKKKFKFKSLVGFILVVALSLLLLNCLFTDYSYYVWRYDNAPEIVTEYYHFFDDKAIEKPVLTTDPVFAAYCDITLIPSYFSVQELKESLEANKEISYFVFVPSLFWCGDDECRNELNMIEQEFEQKHQKVFDKTYEDTRYIIYKIE